MPKVFRRTGQVYQRHPINGAPDGVISNPLPKVSGTASVFDIGTTGQGESDRDKLYAAGFFLPTANFVGRYVLLKNTPPSTGLSGRSKHENRIARIASVDASGDFVRLEAVRFEHASTTVAFSVFAAADFTAPSASFPAEPHTSTDAGPVVGQAIALPNPANKTLQIAPFVIGARTSATVVRISDLFGTLGTIPTEAGLEWFLKDRPAYSTRDLYWMIHDFVLDCGWTKFQDRGNNQNGVPKYLFEDQIFFSDGEDTNKRMYLRWALVNENNLLNGSDSQNRQGMEFAFFSVWDRNIVHTSPNNNRNNGGGINPLAYHPNVDAQENFWAQWDKATVQSFRAPQFNPDQGNGSCLPDHDNDLWGDFDTFIQHPMNDPRGGDFHEYNIMMFGDKDEMQIFIFNLGHGVSHLGLGSLEPLPSQIQDSFITTAVTRAGSNAVVRVGATDPTTLSPPYQVGDNLQIVGQKLLSMDWQNEIWTGEFIETAFIQAIGAVGSIGRIVCVAKSLLFDNTDTFTINDGEGNVVTFYYDVDGLGGGTGTAINVSTDTTAAQVATRTAAAINASLLNMVATPNGDFVDLLHNTPNSPATNVGITEAVQDPGFKVEGMEGSGFGITVDIYQNEYQKGALAGEDPQPIFIQGGLHFTNPYSDTTGTIIVGNRSRNADPSFFDHNGTETGNHAGEAGFPCIMQLVPLESIAELDPSTRTNRFGLLGTFARDIGGNQWRGRQRYFHVMSKKVRPFRFIRDRDGNYYFTVPSLQRRANISTNLNEATIAIGPMPEGLAIPS